MKAALAVLLTVAGLTAATAQVTTARAATTDDVKWINQCVADNKRSREQCEADFADYGNTRGTTRGAVGGQFYDLPECKAAFDARQKYRQ